MAAIPKLQSRGISVEYPQARLGKSVQALSQINLAVHENQFVSILGPSGCGKTTFLNVVAGMIAPSEGSILLDGCPIEGPGDDRAMVFQQASLLPWRTVQRNVLYGLECRKQDITLALPKAKELLEIVGLKGFEHHYPHELSGGMQQRVNLARALLIDPHLLLMDEPFAALDAQTREIMQGELLNIWQKTSKTVLFVTHQIDESVFLSDQVIVFGSRPGRVKATITIPFQRPRGLPLKRTPEFLEYVDRIWNLIESDVRTAARGEK
ncbi:MAG: ABC transporter ATP-binding protein [Acidobacteriota bacterium]|nr:ABC transporter ATP-binding protein [Acidobacteriota bacterium]